MGLTWMIEGSKQPCLLPGIEAGEVPVLRFIQNEMASRLCRKRCGRLVMLGATSGAIRECSVACLRFINLSPATHFNSER